MFLFKNNPYDKSIKQRDKLINKSIKNLYKEAITNIKYSISKWLTYAEINTFTRYSPIIRERSDT